MKNRNQIIYEKVLNGHKISSIASEFKISTANVYQIFKRKKEEAKYTEFRKMMSIRTQNVLLTLFEHDETIFDDPERVCNLSREQLIATKNIGRTTINEIMNACKLIRAQKISVAQTVKFTNVCPVFLVENIQKTTEYYVNVLGFKYAQHFDKKDKFATIYRDSIEIVLVEN